MARPKSDEKRSAILNAAIRIIAAQGLAAPTALIAKEAGISNGALFIYFETKADLLNHLYIELKAEMAAAALDGLSGESNAREKLRHVWSRWLHWAVANPVKRRALTHLGVSAEIKPESLRAGREALSGLVAIVEEARASGPMRDVPLSMVVAVMNAVAEATMDFMVNDPSDANVHCSVAFEAVWRMIA